MTGASEGVITGSTQLTAIFGDPVEHSLSPAMHNAAYAALGLKRAYVPFHVRPDQLRAALRSLVALGICGVNVTIPHKERAVGMVDSLSAEASLLRAVNCVVNRRGKLFGDNTDARGLEHDLGELGAKLRSESALIIGAGGAAAAAVLACLRLRVARIVVANRTASRARALVRRFTSLTRSSKVRFEARGLVALEDRALFADVAIVLNATPMGLRGSRFAPLHYDATRTECFFYDLLYAAGPTAFLTPAIALGRPYADGAGMLVAQGELAFRLFNQVAPPAGVMRQALDRALGRA